MGVRVCVSFSGAGTSEEAWSCAEVRLCDCMPSRSFSVSLQPYERLVPYERLAHMSV